MRFLATKMEFEPRHSTSKRAAVRTALEKLLDHRRTKSGSERLIAGASAFKGSSSLGEGSVEAGENGSRRKRTGIRQGIKWVRRGFVGMLAALIIRTSFTPLSASALPAPAGIAPRGTQAQVTPVLWLGGDLGYSYQDMHSSSQLRFDYCPTMMFPYHVHVSRHAWTKWADGASLSPTSRRHFLDSSMV